MSVIVSRRLFDMPKKPVQLEMDLEGKSDADKW